MPALAGSDNPSKFAVMSCRVSYDSEKRSPMEQLLVQTQLPELEDGESLGQ
jgi:hypothetical protein